MGEQEKFAEFSIEAWEADEKVILGPGGPIGCTLSKRDAQVVLAWLQSAQKELLAQSLARFRERCKEAIKEEFLVEELGDESSEGYQAGLEAAFRVISELPL